MKCVGVRLDESDERGWALHDVLVFSLVFLFEVLGCCIAILLLLYLIYPVELSTRGIL